MPKFNSIAKVFLILALALSSCQTKPFKKIQIKGRLFDYKTKEPILADLILKTDDVKETQGSPGITLITGKTFIDGTFTLKSNASKRDNPQYYLYFKNDTLKQFYNLNVFTGILSNNNDFLSAEERKVTDVGDIYVKF